MCTLLREFKKKTLTKQLAVTFMCSILKHNWYQYLGQRTRSIVNYSFRTSKVQQRWAPISGLGLYSSKQIHLEQFIFEQDCSMSTGYQSVHLVSDGNRQLVPDLPALFSLSSLPLSLPLAHG